MLSKYLALVGVEIAQIISALGLPSFDKGDSFIEKLYHIIILCYFKDYWVPLFLMPKQDTTDRCKPGLVGPFSAE